MCARGARPVSNPAASRRGRPPRTPGLPRRRCHRCRHLPAEPRPDPSKTDSERSPTHPEPPGGYTRPRHPVRSTPPRPGSQSPRAPSTSRSRKRPSASVHGVSRTKPRRPAGAERRRPRPPLCPRPAPAHRGYRRHHPRPENPVRSLDRRRHSRRPSRVPRSRRRPEPSGPSPRRQLASDAPGSARRRLRYRPVRRPHWSSPVAGRNPRGSTHPPLIPGPRGTSRLPPFGRFGSRLGRLSTGVAAKQRVPEDPKQYEQYGEYDASTHECYQVPEFESSSPIRRRFG